MTVERERYVRPQTLAGGRVAWYWSPAKRDIEAGFSIRSEALGPSLDAANARAKLLNAHLDAWRAGRDGIADTGPAPGTFDWLVHVYTRSRDFREFVSPRVQPDYLREMRLVTDVELTRGPYAGRRLGVVPLIEITPKLADRVYARILDSGRNGRRPRQTNVAFSRIVTAWTVASRLEGAAVPDECPFSGVRRTYETTEKPAATRAQAYALADAIAEAGHASLSLVPVICFEWLQRPENILAGHLTWPDWRGAAAPSHVMIDHHKTGKRFPLPLEDDDGPFFADLEARLAAAPRHGVPVVLCPPLIGKGGRIRKPARPFDFHWCRTIVRRVRRDAGLPDWLTLDACRHGGMTELADAGLTESEEMALSAHTTVDAKRRYIKKTEAQRLAALAKRRAHIRRTAA